MVNQIAAHPSHRGRCPLRHAGTPVGDAGYAAKPPSCRRPTFCCLPRRPAGRLLLKPRSTCLHPCSLVACSRLSGVLDHPSRATRRLSGPLCTSSLACGPSRSCRPTRCLLLETGSSCLHSGRLVACSGLSGVAYHLTHPARRASSTRGSGGSCGRSGSSCGPSGKLSLDHRSSLGGSRFSRSAYQPAQSAASTGNIRSLFEASCSSGQPCGSTGTTDRLFCLRSPSCSSESSGATEKSFPGRPKAT